MRRFVLAKSYRAECPLLYGSLFGSFLHSNESLSWKSSHPDISGNREFKPEPKVNISSDPTLTQVGYFDRSHSLL